MEFRVVPKITFCPFQEKQCLLFQVVVIQYSADKFVDFRIYCEHKIAISDDFFNIFALEIVD